MNLSTSAFADRYIDLHLHLDGAVTTDIAKKLAAAQGIGLPDDDTLGRQLTVSPDCTSLNEFLECFALPLSLLQTSEAVSECVRLVCDDLASQGVIYAEIRFAPQLHRQQGMSQEDAVLAALDGLKRTSLKANLILCCMRGSDNDDDNMETVSLAKKYLVADGGVTAIDLAGAEALFPTAKYSGLFSAARAYGIPFTIHAGEADGAESVRAAVGFGAARIGHGVRIFEDEELVRLIAQKGIPLEMCPTSNRQTHAVDNMADYPFMDYLERGIKVTLNTDDPAIEGTNIAAEYRYMEKEFGLTAVQERILLKNSVEAAFTSDEVRVQLLEQLDIAGV